MSEVTDISPGILIPACTSSSLTFYMTYSTYTLNKQGDNIQPCGTLFPILCQSIVPCLVLTLASWPAYRFLRRQVRWSGIPFCWRIFYRFLLSTQSLLAKRCGSNGNSGRLYFLVSKITADGDCSHEIKRRFLLERKAMTSLDSMLKSRDITCWQSSI